MRSMLFVPGDRPERFAKAVASGADAVIFDLEDAVVPERRAAARLEIARYLADAERQVPLWVRINPVTTDDALLDLAAVIDGRPDGIMLPKARDGADVERASHWLESLEARAGLGQGSVGLIPLITESAGAVLNAASFTRLPARVRGLTWGAEDLAADIGALGNRLPDGEFEFTYAYARSMCLLAAAAAGVAGDRHGGHRDSRRRGGRATRARFEAAGIRRQDGNPPGAGRADPCGIQSVRGRGGMGRTRAGGVQRIARGWRGLARRAHARQAAHPPGRAHPRSGGSPLKALTGASS